MMKKNYPLIGFLSLAAAQACVGANITISKHMVTVLPVYVFLQARFSFSFLLLLLITRPIKRLPLMAWRQRDWMMMFIQGFSANFLFNLFMVNGVRFTSAMAAGVITSFLPGIIAILSWLFLHEVLGLRRIACITLGILGLVSVSLGVSSVHHAANSSLFGMLLVFISLFPEGLYTIFTKAFRTAIVPLQQACWLLFFTCLCFLPFFIWQFPETQWAQISITDWGLTLLAGSFSALFFVLWPYGLRFVTGSTAALFMSVMPVTVVLIATTLLGEHFTFYDAFGLLFVMLSIFFGAIVIKPKKHRAIETKVASVDVLSERESARL